MKNRIRVARTEDLQNITDNTILNTPIADGQPFYDKTSNKLYIGQKVDDSGNIRDAKISDFKDGTIEALNATHANTSDLAGKANKDIENNIINETYTFRSSGRCYLLFTDTDNPSNPTSLELEAFQGVCGIARDTNFNESRYIYAVDNLPVNITTGNYSYLFIATLDADDVLPDLNNQIPGLVRFTKLFDSNRVITFRANDLSYKKNLTYNGKNYTFYRYTASALDTNPVQVSFSSSDSYLVEFLSFKNIH